MLRGSLLRVVVALALVTGAQVLSMPGAEAAPTFTLSGVVSNPIGTVYDGSVNVYDLSGDFVGSTSIDHQGHYSLTLEAGTYSVDIVETTAGPDAVGLSAGFEVMKKGVVVSNNTVLDVEGHWQHYTVHLVGPDGLPRRASLQVGCSQQRDENGNFVGEEVGSMNEGTGDVDLWVSGPSPDGTPASCDIIVIPHDGSLQVVRGLLISSTDDTELTRLIPDPVTLSGHVATSEGPGSTVGITITDSAGLQVVQEYTDNSTDGHYSVRVAPGTYRVALRAITPHEDLTLEKTGVVIEPGVDKVMDGSLDTVPVTIHLVDAEGEPAEGSVDMQCGRQDPGTNFNAVALDSRASGTGTLTVRGIPTQAGSATDPIVGCGVTNAREGGVAIQNPEIFVRPTGAEMNYVVPTGLLEPTDSGDEDGVPDITESYGPHQGDGNNDGIKDYDQANVTSLPANGSPNNFTAFVTVAGPAGSSLANVSTMDPNSASTPPPVGTTLPAGLTTFVLKGVSSGSDQTVSIYGGSTENVNGYAKYDADAGTWSTLPANRVHVFADHVDVTLTDGGVGDDDGSANGQISDPGGMAIVPMTGDTTPPVVVGRATTRPNANGWYRGDVRIHWSATDPGSGVKKQPEDTIVTTQGANVTAASGQVCDKATPTANCTTGSLTGLKIDKTAPSLAVTGVTSGATYTLGAVPAVGCAASDALSGLAGGCAGVKVGGNSAGVGGFGYAAAVGDKAGNSRAAAASWSVVYGFGGFAAPLNDPAVTPGAATSIFKAGSTVPVAFSLKKANGQVATPTNKPTWVSVVKGAKTTAPVNEAVSNAAGTSGSAFVWRNSRWEFNWSTKGLAAGYLYRIGVKLDDGTTHYLTVGLR
jgi:hypothetical protein